KNVSVLQATEFFMRFREETGSFSASAHKKYEAFFRLRLLPWSKENRKVGMKAFEDPLVVKAFFMSWRNLQPERGKPVVLDSDVDLGKSTKAHELERFRTFLEFCVNNQWIGKNYAKAPHIKVKTPKPGQKRGFTHQEWLNIDTTLLALENRYEDRK